MKNLYIVILSAFFFSAVHAQKLVVIEHEAKKYEGNYIKLVTVDSEKLVSFNVSILDGHYLRFEYFKNGEVAKHKIKGIKKMPFGVYLQYLDLVPTNNQYEYALITSFKKKSRGIIHKTIININTFSVVRFEEIINEESPEKYSYLNAKISKSPDKHHTHVVLFYGYTSINSNNARYKLASYTFNQEYKLTNKKMFECKYDSNFMINNKQEISYVSNTKENILFTRISKDGNKHFGSIKKEQKEYLPIGIIDRDQNFIYLNILNSKTTNEVDIAKIEFLASGKIKKTILQNDILIDKKLYGLLNFDYHISESNALTFQFTTATRSNLLGPKRETYIFQLKEDKLKLLKELDLRKMNDRPAVSYMVRINNKLLFINQLGTKFKASFGNNNGVFDIVSYDIETDKFGEQFSLNLQDKKGNNNTLSEISFIASDYGNNFTLIKCMLADSKYKFLFLTYGEIEKTYRM